MALGSFNHCVCNRHLQTSMSEEVWLLLAHVNTDNLLVCILAILFTLCCWGDQKSLQALSLCFPQLHSCKEWRELVKGHLLSDFVQVVFAPLWNRAAEFSSFEFIHLQSSKFFLVHKWHFLSFLLAYNIFQPWLISYFIATYFLKTWLHTCSAWLPPSSSDSEAMRGHDETNRMEPAAAHWSDIRSSPSDVETQSATALWRLLNHLRFSFYQLSPEDSFPWVSRHE